MSHRKQSGGAVAASLFTSSFFCAQMLFALRKAIACLHVGRIRATGSLGMDFATFPLLSVLVGY